MKINLLYMLECIFFYKGLRFTLCMEAYLNICREVLENGVRKENRTGVDTLVVDATMFRHDMANGFPLLTTKRTAYKNVRSESEFFIKGITDKKWLQDRGNHIWDDWCNPTKVAQIKYDDRSKEIIKDVLGDKYIGISKDIFNVAKMLEEDHRLRKQYGVSFEDFERLENLSKNRLDMSKERDLGPIYGFQWRHFGAKYSRFDDNFAKYLIKKGLDFIENGSFKKAYEIDYSNRGIDKLADVVNTLKINPMDRRMVVSAWNEEAIPQMALPPCHYSFQVNVIGNKLNLAWNQRSVDVPLGLPFNIASYATMLHLLAKESGFEEGILTGFLMDTHIYENQIDGIKEQIGREPLTLPKIETENFTSIFDWNFTDTKLLDYKSHPVIKFPIAV